MRAYRVRFTSKVRPRAGEPLEVHTTWYYRSRIAAEKAAFYLGRLAAKVEPIQSVNIRMASLRD